MMMMMNLETSQLRLFFERGARVSLSRRINADDGGIVRLSTRSSEFLIRGAFCQKPDWGQIKKRGEAGGRLLSFLAAF